MNEIRFGTDGWRAIIARDFTFKNVAIIAQAYADYLHDSGHADKPVAVSYDTRFMSEEFATRIAEVIAGNRIHVILSREFTPTPVLSYAVKNRRLAGGIMVTASHNPYTYSGIKFKDYYGGPALPGLTKAIENNLSNASPVSEDSFSKKFLTREDLFQDYRNFLENYLDLHTLSLLNGRVVINPMNGAACGILENILRQLGIDFHIINGEPDPTFRYRSPEPIPKHLADLKESVMQTKAQIGIATDGDADRFGILDQFGTFVELHDLMPILFQYLLISRNWKGMVVRTTSMADTIDKVAAAQNVEVTEVPVGFKNITEAMLEKDVLIGGEESGGFGYKNHIPERDGILSSLLLLEMLASGKKPIDEYVRQLRNEFGPFAYGRIDQYHELDSLKNNLTSLKKYPPTAIGGFEIKKMNLIDGIKFYFTDASWMLIRVSQTEPLGRIYVGSTDKDKVNTLLNEGLSLITK